MSTGKYRLVASSPMSIPLPLCGAWVVGLGPGVLGRTSRRGVGRVEGSFWVSRESGGEGNGGDTVDGVEGKGCLTPHSPAAKELSHRAVHQLLLRFHLWRQG